MSNFKIDGWTVILIAVILALSYGFAAWQTKVNVPIIAAEVSGNKVLLGQLNEAFQNQNKALQDKFTKIETRLDTLERTRK